jgi:hypothetical protein
MFGERRIECVPVTLECRARIDEQRGAILFGKRCYGDVFAIEFIVFVFEMIH